MAVPTVKVKSDLYADGYVVINESDFDESEHELFVEGESDERAEAPKRRGRPPKAKPEDA